MGSVVRRPRRARQRVSVSWAEIFPALGRHGPTTTMIVTVRRTMITIITGNGIPSAITTGGMGSTKTGGGAPGSLKSSAVTTDASGPAIHAGGPRKTRA